MPSSSAFQSQRFGDYYLTAHLGRGGMADVYRARYVGAAGFQRTVVVKRVLNVSDPECIRMFINEAKLAAELTHPNVAQIYELGEADGEFFIAMEYVRGKDLGNLMYMMASRKTLPPPAVAAFVAREVCRALAHAHAHVDQNSMPSPIIHRDVSPANIVIGYDGQVKLVDFGIAKALHAGPEHAHTQAGIIKGKLSYMAPEQLDGLALPQSDLFATGVVLHEVLTLRRLLKGESPLETITKVKTMPFPPPSKFSAGVPPALDVIVLKSLERNLDARYPNAASMAKDLDLFLQAAGFSIEDMGRFMSALYPVEMQTEPSTFVSAPYRIGTPVSQTNTPPRSSPGTLMGVAPGMAMGVAQGTVMGKGLGTTMDEAPGMVMGEPPSMVIGEAPGARRNEPSMVISFPRLPATRRRTILGAAVLLGSLILGSYLAYRISRQSDSTAAIAELVPRASPVVAASPPPQEPARAPITMRGVTDREIVFGMATALSGSGKQYGHQMKTGSEVAFQVANDAGGVHGRRLRLVTADDGYEPTRTVNAMRELYEHQNVFGIVGNFGTSTAAVAVPFVLDHKILFFGAYSGASLLRRDPPDRYVFNFRASYAEEASAIVKYLVRVRHIRPERIVVFAQEDAFGEAVYASMSKAMRSLRPDVTSIFRVGYQRNTIDVSDAAAQLHARLTPVEAVVLLAIYRPAARFIEQVRDMNRGAQFITGSWADSSGLAEELKMLGPQYGTGLVMTQVVPLPDSSATAVLNYRAAMAKYAPDERTDSTSLEAYLMTNLLIEGLRRAGPDLDTERLVNTLEGIRDFDLGIGTSISFGSGEHQGSHKVWGIKLDDTGHYQPIDLE